MVRRKQETEFPSGPGSWWDSTWWARPDGWTAWREHGTVARGKDFGELARSLMRSCNIDDAHFVGLCDALYFAYHAFEAEQLAQSIAAWPPLRIGHIGNADPEILADRAHENDADPKTLADRAHEHAKRAAMLFGRLPLELYPQIEKAFHDATGGRLLGEKTIHELGGLDVELPDESLVPFWKIVSGVASALEVAKKGARKRRGRKGAENMGKRAFMPNLYRFWTGTLKRKFSVKFESDWGDEEPQNDESRFCLLALRGLVDPEITGASCKYLMADVIKRARAAKAS